MYEVIPYVGIGEIRFGMGSNEVSGLLGKDYRRIDNRYTAGYMLCTGSLNLHFDGNNILVAIEGSINAGLCYQGFALAGRPFNEVLTYLKGFDPKIKAHRDGATSHQLGIGFCPYHQKVQKGTGTGSDRVSEGVLWRQRGGHLIQKNET